MVGAQAVSTNTQVMTVGPDPDILTAGSLRTANGWYRWDLPGKQAGTAVSPQPDKYSDDGYISGSVRFHQRMAYLQQR